MAIVSFFSHSITAGLVTNPETGSHTLPNLLEFQTWDILLPVHRLWASHGLPELGDAQGNPRRYRHLPAERLGLHM